MNDAIIISWLYLQNEVAILEFIHLIVETLDKYFPKVVSLGYFDSPCTSVCVWHGIMIVPQSSDIGISGMVSLGV